MSSYREVDSYTLSDGTKFVALAGSSGTRIRKINPDGKETLLASSKKDTSRNTNANIVQKQFSSFKKGLEKAEAGEQLTYSEEDIKTDATAGRGILGQQKDTASTITLSDGTTLSAIYGKTADEVRTVKRLADEIGAVSAASVTEDTTEDTVTGKVDDETRLEGADEIVGRDIIEATQIDLGDTKEADAAEAALAEVGQAGAAAFGGRLVGDTTQGTESFAQSVGPAEDEAMEMYTKGRRATIATGPRGLLTGVDEQEDPRFRRRRSLLAG
jgi:hypothetical protein